MGGAQEPIALPSRREGLALYGLFVVIVLIGTACLATALLLPVATVLSFGAIGVFLLCRSSALSEVPQSSASDAANPMAVAHWRSASYSAPADAVASIERIEYDPRSIDIAMRMDTTDAIARALHQCAATWCFTNVRYTDDTRRNAGASTVVERTLITCRRGAQGPFVSNVNPWVIDAVPRLLLLFPDFLGVLQSGALTRIPYSSITVKHRATRFVEEGPVPPDATVLEMTWRFVCRDGSPDLRFADNRQVPVLEYGEVELSDGAQSVTFQTSAASAARVVAESFVRLGALSPDAPSPVVAAPPVAPALQNPFGPVLVLPPISELEAIGQPSTVRAPTAPDPSAANPPTSSSLVASITARDLALVLKRVALADRRFSRDELERITDIVREWDPSACADPAVLRDSIEAMRCDDATFDGAIARCAAAPVEQRARLYALCQDVARADGRVTPKETERLAAIARALMVEG